MDEREKMTMEREARARAGDPRRTDDRVPAVNRFLAAFAYADAGSDRPPRPETSAPKPSR